MTIHKVYGDESEVYKYDQTTLDEAFEYIDDVAADAFDTIQAFDENYMFSIHFGCRGMIYYTMFYNDIPLHRSSNKTVSVILDEIYNTLIHS